MNLNYWEPNPSLEGERKILSRVFASSITETLHMRNWFHGSRGPAVTERNEQENFAAHTDFVLLLKPIAFHLVLLPSSLLKLPINFRITDTKSVACSQTLYFLLQISRACVLKIKTARDLLTASARGRGWGFLSCPPLCYQRKRPLLLLPEDTLRSNSSIPVSEKTWCVRLNAVPATKRTSERLEDA